MHNVNFIGLPLMSSTNSPKCSNMSTVQGKESFPQPKETKEKIGRVRAKNRYHGSSLYQ